MQRLVSHRSVLPDAGVDDGDVQTSAVNLADSSMLYVSVNGTGGTLYPFTSNAILLTAGAGSCSFNLYVTPGTVIQSVNITDASGVPLLTGN